jgi:hypothetical protein
MSFSPFDPAIRHDRSPPSLVSGRGHPVTTIVPTMPTSAVPWIEQ